MTSYAVIGGSRGCRANRLWIATAANHDFSAMPSLEWAYLWFGNQRHAVSKPPFSRVYDGKCAPMGCGGCLGGW
jgi:hypothetical protein